jgi:mxaJ protein
MGHRRVAVILTLALQLAAPVHASARQLLVCADPNNLPFSNEAQEGFENKIVDMVANDLDATVTYTWWAQRRGNVRETLKRGLCDLIPGVASSLEMLATTRPYYRSTYVFVSRAGVTPAISSLDDPRLRTLRIGIQMIGDDGSNSPPAHALSRRGIIDNVRGYMVYGNYNMPNAAGGVIKAIAAGEVDVAIAWGPLAGYFAKHSSVPLTLAPVSPWLDGPRLPMRFDISMGTRKGDTELRKAVEQSLARHAREIRALLQSYGVPLLIDEAGLSSAP